MTVNANAVVAQFDDPCSISPKVYQLAQPVYHQFELLRDNHVDVDFSGLLQLIIDLLQEMDKVCVEKCQMTMEVNMHVAEKSDLIFQWERAKKLREAAEKRLNFVEDELMGVRKAAREKIENLEASLRHREMLNKNAHEHVKRLEEHNALLQGELSATHERYTELLRTHVDQVERSRLSIGGGSSTAASSVIGGWSTSRRLIGGGPAGDPSDFIMPPLDSAEIPRGSLVRGLSQEDEVGSLTPRGGTPTNEQRDEASIAQQAAGLSGAGQEAYGFDSSGLLVETAKANDRVASFIDLMDETMEYESVYASSLGPDQDEDEDTIPFSESAVDGVDGMVREVEKLIHENMELGATKNALNIVKNDLIKQLDDVTGEKAVLADELQSLRASRDEARDEANRLARQLHHCRNQLDSLKARMQLYESQSEGLASLAPSVSCSALSVHDLESTGCRRLDQPGGATGAAVSSQRLGGSLDCLTSVGRSTGQPGGDLLARRCEAIREYSVRHGGGALVDAESAVGDPARLLLPGTEGHFTKREMARILAERNHYKERLLELQEAIRFTEELRAGRLYEEQLGRNSSFDCQPESPVNSVSARSTPRRTGAGDGFAARLLASLRQATSGLGELISGLESSPPVEARCDGIPTLSSSGSIRVRGRGSSVSLRTPTTTSRVDSSVLSPSNQVGNRPAYLRHMFSHLIGHAVATGAEAVLGTGNDFSTRVASQALTDDVSQMLGDPVWQSRPQSPALLDIPDTIS